MTSDTYTRPERAAEIAVARRVRANVMRCGGCAMCVHRLEAWGRSVCGLEPSKSFPACVDADKGFTLDTGRVRPCEE